MALLSHFYGKVEIIINPRLILEIPNDPDSSKHQLAENTGRNPYFEKRFNLKKVALLLLILVLPISVSAGFLSNIFKSANAEGPVYDKNLQNMALLVPTKTPLADESSAPTIEGDALVSNTGPAGSAAEVMNHKPQSDQISVYVVREGDTLSQIAEMFNVTVNTIKWGNDLSSNTVRPGDTLVILPISGTKHVVAKGDTVESIAKKYKGDADEIFAYNDISKGSALTVGTTIIVPNGEVTVSTSYSSSGSKPTTSGSKEYAGYYVRPIVGGKKTQGIHGHNGVDIGAPEGTNILAAAAGEVIISRTGGWNGGYGNYIVIRHSNGTQTLYAHNSANYVSAGNRVEQGEVIGAVGHSGSVSGPTGNHLHFEIRGAKNPF